MRSVLSYFRSHPQAADNVEGVAHWRLLEETVRNEIVGTGRALRWLADHGFLIEESMPGVSPLYRLDPTQSGEPDVGEPEAGAPPSGSVGRH